MMVAALNFETAQNTTRATAPRCQSALRSKLDMKVGCVFITSPSPRPCMGHRAIGDCLNCSEAAAALKSFSGQIFAIFDSNPATRSGHIPFCSAHLAGSEELFKGGKSNRE